MVKAPACIEFDSYRLQERNGLFQSERTNFTITLVLGLVLIQGRLNKSLLRTSKANSPFHNSYRNIKKIRKGTMPSTTAAALAAVLSSVASVASAFTTPSSSATTRAGKTTTQLYSTVDPTVVTKKEYQDICGVDFDDNALTDRLKKTAYLYPKHVEVIEDFEPLVNKMVDDIVSSLLLLLWRRGG